MTGTLLFLAGLAAGIASMAAAGMIVVLMHSRKQAVVEKQRQAERIRRQDFVDLMEAGETK